MKVVDKAETRYHHGGCSNVLATKLGTKRRSKHHDVEMVDRDAKLGVRWPDQASARLRILAVVVRCLQLARATGKHLSHGFLFLI